MFCSNCGKENNDLRNFVFFVGIKLKPINNGKEVYSDLQNQYKDKIVGQLVEAYFEDKVVENDVFINGQNYMIWTSSRWLISFHQSKITLRR